MNPNRNKKGQYSKSNILPPFCKFCKITRVKTPRNINCSEKCQAEARRGTVGASKGRKYSEEHRIKIGLGNWKGDLACYAVKHIWMVKNYGRPTKCEHCFKDGLTGRKIHWANKDHKYRRVREDWIRLCVPCHSKYDKLKNGDNKNINS